MNTIKWTQSRTIWLAIAQVVGGVILLLGETSYSSAGWFLELKSLVDIWLRFQTDKPIEP